MLLALHLKSKSTMTYSTATFFTVILVKNLQLRLSVPWNCNVIKLENVRVVFKET